MLAALQTAPANPAWFHRYDDAVDRSSSTTHPRPSRWITPHQARQATSYRSRLYVSASGRSLPQPMVVEIRRTDDEVTIVDEEFGVYGAGETLDAATRDFYAALLDYRAVLASRPRLSTGLQQMLSRLASLI